MGLHLGDFVNEVYYQTRHETHIFGPKRCNEKVRADLCKLFLSHVLPTATVIIPLAHNYGDYRAGVP